MAIRNTRRGFTLVEMLVVIGIIATLAGVLMGVMSGGTDSARAAKCLTNMKNLANACHSYGMANGVYPEAGSIEYFKPNTSKGIGHVKMEYRERRGWISWFSKDNYPSESKRKNPYVGMFSTDEEQSLFALTNGALWRYMSESKAAYVCPIHGKAAGKGVKINWSYLMNAQFGWDAANGSFSYPENAGYCEYGHLSGTDRMLLFSEVPFQGPGSWFPSGEGATMDTDCVLQYNGCNKASTAMGKSRRNGSETIGFNHKNGKHWYAHVVFVDGHVEKLRGTDDSGKYMDETQIKNLTTWLCEGKDVSFDGTRYDKMTD